MRVTVIFPDAAVYVDGEARVVTMPPHDANWRALQWYGQRGDVEVCVGPSFAVTDERIVAPFVRAWEFAAPAIATALGQPAAGVEEM